MRHQATPLGLEPQTETRQSMNRIVSDRHSDLRRAAFIGFAAGLRSQVPFFALSRAAGNGTFAGDAGRPLSWLRVPRIQMMLGLSAAGEMIVDKAPFVPNRTDPGPLFGRVAIGAAAGAAIATDAGAATVEGAVAGVIGAAIGSFAGRHGRAWLVRILRVPDFVVALAEDGLALGLGHHAAQRANALGSSPLTAPAAL